MVRLFTAHTNQGQASPLAGVADAFKAEEDAKRMDEALRLQGEKFKQDKAVAALSFDLEERKLAVRQEESQQRQNELDQNLQWRTDEGALDREAKATEGEANRAAQLAIAQEKVKTAQDRQDEIDDRRLKKEEKDLSALNATVTTGASQAEALQTLYENLPDKWRPGPKWAAGNAQPVVDALEALSNANPGNLAVLVNNLHKTIATAKEALDVESKEFYRKGVQVEVTALTEKLSGDYGLNLGLSPSVVENSITGMDDTKNLLKDRAALLKLEVNWDENFMLKQQLKDIKDNPANTGYAGFKALVAADQRNQVLGEGQEEQWDSTAAQWNKDMKIWRDASDETTVEQRNLAGRQAIAMVGASDEVRAIMNQNGVLAQRAKRDAQIAKDAAEAKAFAIKGANSDDRTGWADFNPSGPESMARLNFMAHYAPDGAKMRMAQEFLLAIRGAGAQRIDTKSNESYDDIAMARALRTVGAADIQATMAYLRTLEDDPEYMEYRNRIKDGAAKQREAMDGTDLKQTTERANDEDVSAAEARGLAPGSVPR